MTEASVGPVVDSSRLRLEPGMVPAGSSSMGSTGSCVKTSSFGWPRRCSTCRRSTNDGRTSRAREEVRGPEGEAVGVETVQARSKMARSHLATR
jgi:hypothetical protein